jgi:hypothetical protein
VFRSVVAFSIVTSLYVQVLLEWKDMMTTSLPLFLALIVVIAVIVLVLIGVGVFRTRSYKGEADRTTPEPGIDTQGDTIKDRLGTPDLHEKGLEPRGDDVGGNFSGVSNRGDTSDQNRPPKNE